MNALGFSILVVLMLLVLGASRRMALLGMMAGVLFLTQAQEIHIWGLHLYAIRFLELAGFVRVMFRREFSFTQLNRIDRIFLWFYGYITVVFLLRSTEGVANQIGMSMDAFLCYFTLRALMRNLAEFREFLHAFVLLLAPYTLLVMTESLTHHNLFVYLGGIEGGDMWMRHGMPRCFGSFRQPDTLGVFAASFLPLYIGLALDSRERKRATLGVWLCLIIVIAANSGGSVSSAAVGLIGWAFWRYRFRMRTVRWGIIATLAGLALLMKAPIWYIFDRISSITGGDGWHRSYLIDVAYRHLSQWWLAGMPISQTADWFTYNLSFSGSHRADITNEFIGFGLSAGLGAIVLFVLLLKRAYRTLGTAMSDMRSSPLRNQETEFLLWGLGCVLTVHIVGWFGIPYFDQIYVVWFLHLAAISNAGERAHDTLGAAQFVDVEPVSLIFHRIPDSGNRSIPRSNDSKNRHSVSSFTIATGLPSKN